MLLLALLAWTELVWRHSDVPANVATIVMADSGITWLGMAVFSLFFGLLSRFGPTESDAKSQLWQLRPYAVGLLTREPVRPSLLIFVLLMLATVTFDGFMATPLWTELAQWMMYFPLSANVEVGQVKTSCLGLCGLVLLSLTVYLVFSGLMRIAVGRECPMTTGDIAGLSCCP